MAKDKNIEAQRKANYLANTPARKAKRKAKRAQNKKYNYWNKTWTCPDTGKTMQHCDYFGTCEFPCNGDC